MRQNPMMSSRVQVGGRPMPSWFSASLVNQSRTTMSTPPPLPAEPPPSEPESEYEEIDHLHVRKSTGRRNRSCSLCGNPNPVVSCEMCDNQIFCGSCNDMYHRHPKRLHHARKILEALESRPPLPPKTFLAPEPAPMPQDEPPLPQITSTLPPVPPPRKNKSRFGMRSATSSPSITRKALFDPVGSIKRFVGGMGQRPLPPPPKPAPPLPPKTIGRAVTPVGGQAAIPLTFDRRNSSPSPHAIPGGPGMYPSDRNRNMTLNAQEMQMQMQMHNARHQSFSVANLNNQFGGSRENGFGDWEEEEDFFARQRAHSISTPHGRYPASSHDASHFATLQRPKRGGLNAPERPPPPLPPRSASSSQTQLGFQSSQSVFNLNQMGMPQQFNVPWNYPGHGYPPYDFQQQQQQAAMMGYPGTMRRTPSNSSMGGGPMPPQFFQWGPMGFGPPMSQQEMEREMFAARRGSEPPAFANQRGSSVSQPVTPQGSFRKKTRPSLNQERQQAAADARINERFIQNNQHISQQQRSTTPSSFVRVKPITSYELQGNGGGNGMFSQSQLGRGNEEFETSSSPNNAEMTESPEGPWTCEHCTFINPKSTKICTICCKTPSDGYRPMNKNGPNKPNSHSRKGSSGSEIHEEIPIVESKLSIFRGEKQQTTINLVERVEKVRTPTDPRSPKQGVLRNGISSSTTRKTEEPEDELLLEEENGEDEDDLLDDELEQQAQQHQLTINTKKPKVVAALSNSNEDVYGSVPIQALTISPKIDIRRTTKTVTSTGVGSSPPKVREDTKPKDNPPKTFAVDTSSGPNKKYTKSSKDKNKLSPSNSLKSKSSDSNENVEIPSRHGSGFSTSPEQTTRLENVKIPVEGTKISKIVSSLAGPAKRLSVSTGVQADAIESGNESNRSITSNSSSCRSSELISSASDAKVTAKTSIVTEKKKSKGTSPPPQSISTQTYEEIPTSSMRRHKSMSKTSMTSMQSLQSDDFAPPKPVEMSEKALRYARKAQHHHQAKLKRSMSTHLTSASEPWVDMVDGRNLYRSSSRHSLLSDTRSLPLSGPPSRDTSPPPRSSRFYEDIKRFQPPSWDRFPTPEDYFASFEDLVSRRRRDSARSQEFELSRLLKDAEEFNYTPEDIQVALRMCGERNPIKWLQENWSSMIETVQTLATKYGREKGQENNQIGTISSTEAKDALRVHKGNVWAAVTECVEQRRKKFKELQSRGTFLRDDILTALTANHGNLDAAYVELSKAQLKPFLMRIWGPPSGLDNDAVPPSPTVKNFDSEQATVQVMHQNETPVNKQEPSPEKTDVSLIDLDKPLILESASAVKSTSSSTLNEQKTQLEEQPKPIQVTITQLEPDPKLEILVSSAAKVTQEIEKAIQELKMSKSKQTEAGAEEKSVPEVEGQNVEFETECKSPVSLAVKSDEGEDESFADAVSDSDAASINRDEKLVQEVDEDLEDEYDEDILEIEIDDTEAHISEFIQNYEIVPPKPLPLTVDRSIELDSPNGTTKESSNGLLILGELSSSVDAEPKKQGKTKDDFTGQEEIRSLDPKDNESNSIPEIGTLSSNILSANDLQNTNRLSSAELEQLLSTLTSTFTEMGQFANEIKDKIANEIQQQLAAAVATTAKNVSGEVMIDSSQEPPEGLYEPITLPESISENVNKKIAKYKRLAAKKQQKISRHKSPENRALLKLSKELSSSPSPASSRADLSREDLSVPATSDTNNEEAISASSSASESAKPTTLPSYVDAEIEITGSEVVDEIQSESEDSSGKQIPSDYQVISLERDEEEYDSGSDSVSYEDEEVDEEELEGESEAEESEEDVGSSEEVEQLSRNDEESKGIDYEEVEISHSSDYDLYSNKDTDKMVINSAEANISFATPTADIIFDDSSSSINLDPEVEMKQKQENGEPPNPLSEIEMKISRILGEGKGATGEKAELAKKLMDMNFGEEDSIYAATECSSLYAALSFLQQECDLCAGKFSARQMVSLLRCTHICCQNCAKEYFTVQIRDKTIVDATCPFCTEPSNLTEDPEMATDYFNHLDILLKSLIEPRYHEMFQRKLRDWALAKTPNFKWCSKCSSGFITEPLQTRLICPDCNAVTCAICLEEWDKSNHDHKETKVKVCDSSSKSIVDYLNENCVECPRCHFRFSLARGGCMHLTCTQCRHEFCSGCSAPFRMGDKCEAKLPVCERLGLHAHHPRNCLFYLRDKEPEILNKLLEENAIPYLKEDSGASAAVAIHNQSEERTCQVPIQKETSDGLKDDVCGKEAPPGFATVCKAHYVEYLGLLIWQNHLDPISILSTDDLEVIIRRACKKHPGRPYPTSDEDFRKRLLKVINDEIPL